MGVERLRPVPEVGVEVPAGVHRPQGGDLAAGVGPEERSGIVARDKPM